MFRVFESPILVLRCLAFGKTCNPKYLRSIVMFRAKKALDSAMPCHAKTICPFFFNRYTFSIPYVMLRTKWTKSANFSVHSKARIQSSQAKEKTKKNANNFKCHFFRKTNKQLYQKNAIYHLL